ncbi:MAG TPA: hypothetical protein VFK51_04585 [Burkholderiales bacterium]|nr:hypothetical protein [Burkholderiales bacterium]
MPNFAGIAGTRSERADVGLSGRHRIGVISGEYAGRKIVLDGLMVSA